MTFEELNSMKVVELKEYCVETGIDVESKIKDKPTKAELIDSIVKIEAIDTPDEIKELEESVPKKTKTLSKQEAINLKRKIQKSELMPQRRCIIRSNQTNQTPPPEFEWITWGNDNIGHQTDKVIFDRPWHVREGCLRNLRKVTYRKSVPSDPSAPLSKPVFRDFPLYSIEMLDPLTPKELKIIAERQTIIDSSQANLI